MKAGACRPPLTDAITRSGFVTRTNSLAYVHADEMRSSVELQPASHLCHKSVAGPCKSQAAKLGCLYPRAATASQRTAAFAIRATASIRFSSELA